MTRLAVSVEGQTEEEFVKNVLAEHLRGCHVEATPILVGRVRGRTGGGNVSVHRLASDMAMLFGGFDFVTSLVDFYGFLGKGDSSPDLVMPGPGARIRRIHNQRLGGAGVRAQSPRQRRVRGAGPWMARSADLASNPRRRSGSWSGRPDLSRAVRRLTA